MRVFSNAMSESRKRKQNHFLAANPRHLRRRATSHNTYKPSLRERQAAEEKKQATASSSSSSLSSSNEPAHLLRHQKRNAHRLLSLQQRVERTNRWTETHIWHAKRMTMRDAWGVRLAHAPSDHSKSVRFALQSSKQACNLHDSSYVQLCELEGSQASIIRLLRELHAATGNDGVSTPPL